MPCKEVSDNDDLDGQIAIQVIKTSVVQTIESPTKYLVVQVVGLYNFPDKAVSRLTIKKLRVHVQCLSLKAQVTISLTTDFR